jgi:hypothetical protein
MAPTVLVEPLGRFTTPWLPIADALVMDLVSTNFVATESVRRSHWASVMVTAGLLATPGIGEEFADHDVRILIKLELLRDVAEDQIGLALVGTRQSSAYHFVAPSTTVRSKRLGLHDHGGSPLDSAELRRLAIRGNSVGRRGVWTLAQRLPSVRPAYSEVRSAHSKGTSWPSMP